MTDLQYSGGPEGGSGEVSSAGLPEVDLERERTYLYHVGPLPSVPWTTYERLADALLAAPTFTTAADIVELEGLAPGTYALVRITGVDDG